MPSRMVRPSRVARPLISPCTEQPKCEDAGGSKDAVLHERAGRPGLEVGAELGLAGFIEEPNLRALLTFYV